MRIPSSCGHVYVIEARGRVKIGRSKTPRSRIRTLATQGGSRPERIHITPLHENYQRTELDAHAVFHAHRVVGEWFDVSFETAVTIVESLFQRYGEISDERVQELLALEDAKAAASAEKLTEMLLPRVTAQAKPDRTAEDRADAWANGHQLAIDAYMNAKEDDDLEGAAIVAMKQICAEIDEDMGLGLLGLHSFIEQLIRLSICESCGSEAAA